MYCPNCGKQNEEDAKFCAHCGADMTPAEDAQPAQPAPTAVPPQPVEPAAPTPAPPTPQAAPPPPVQPTPPPVAQPAAPPSGTIPPAPAAAAGEPAKKGTSCWLIGCGILLVLAILGGIGTCIVAKRAVDEGGEVISQIRTEIEQGASEVQGSGGLVINEGDDDGGSSSSSVSGSGDAAVSDAPAAAVSAVELMFAAWARGDVQGTKSRMTTEVADENADELFSTGYNQVSFEITGAEEVSSTEWAFVVKEEFRNYNEDNVQSETYGLRVTEMPSGWKISSLGMD